MQDDVSDPPLVFTVGHSNRPLQDFLRVLQAHRVTLVVDVRKMPRSRRNPQFGPDNLPQALRGSGIGYVHLPGLGGLRRRRPDSPNTGWQNASFQGYADYVLTPEFEQGLHELLERARGERAAVMCAEAVPWRCHRSLIADALTVRGIPVKHILSASRTQPHLLRPWARVQGHGSLTQPRRRNVFRPERRIDPRQPIDGQRLRLPCQPPHALEALFLVPAPSPF